MNSIQCDNHKNYIEILSLNNDLWQNGDWIFRGQNSVKHELKASIYRDQQVVDKIFNHLEKISNKSFIELSERIKTTLEKITKDEMVLGENTKDKIDNLVNVVKYNLCEIFLVNKFLNYSNSIGLYVPSLSVVSDLESTSSFVGNFLPYLSSRKIIENFFKPSVFKSLLGMDSMKSLIKINSSESLALSRHHGVPNRLLDWTTDPLVAAFFSGYERKNSDDVCVFAINKEKFSLLSSDFRIEFHENAKLHGLEFMRIQKGLFVEIVGMDKDYYKKGKWPTLEECFPDLIQNSNCFKKIILKGNEVEDLIKRLGRMKIDKHYLMPTYDNVAHSVLNNFR